MDRNGKSGSSRRLRWAALAGLILLGIVGYFVIRDVMLERELAFEPPDAIPANATLVAFANSEGKSAFARNCASCHGADMKGSVARGVPDLTDSDWLYDFGRVSDIERTILYGIRAGNGKSHNVTDMPGIGRVRALDRKEIGDVVSYVMKLSGRPADESAASRGEALFQDKGVCYDCHGRDGTGIPYYGAPNLTDKVWVYGGDEAAITKSIYDGRHGLCPAWYGKLSYPAIRALAVYIHSMSKESPYSPNNTAKKAQSSAQSGPG